MSTRRKALSTLGAAVAALLSLLAFDFTTSLDRVKEFAQIIADNPGPSASLGLFLAVIIWINWDGILKATGIRRWRDHHQLGEELRAWLRPAGYALLDLDSDPEDSFTFSASDIAGRPVTISKNREDHWLKFSTRLTAMQPNDRATIASMGPAAREAMLLEVSKEMISFGINNLGGTPEAGQGTSRRAWGEQGSAPHRHRR